MSTLYVPDREALPEALEALQPGDCILTDSFSCLARSTKELLAVVGSIEEKHADLKSAAEKVDTTGAKGSFFFHICRELAALDRSGSAERRREGIERAREEGRYRGRKPIEVDETLFDSVVERWQSGEITAREAMGRLELKPNTFYRRIKEREELKMKEYKKMEKEIRSEVKETARQSRKAMDDLKKQVRAEAKELKKAADDRLDAHDVEREIRKDRIRAELEHADGVRQMKKDVEAEAAELKKVLGTEAE